MKGTALSALFLSLTVAAGAVAAQGAYLAIYGDAGRTVTSIDIPAPYFSFDTYVFAYPGTDGLICADFRMETPEWVLNTGTDYNADIIIALIPNPPYDEDGTWVCLTTCSYDPIWLCRVHHLPAAAGYTGEITLTARPSVGRVQAATCEQADPLEEMEVFCMFGINYEPGCWNAAETSTWGAIKDICAEQAMRQAGPPRP